ncbi:MAG: DUF1343 domain-containing protein, partial [Bacteroidales bacterium]|nr:DUF1343 domain-containing protein [Bacteroidales bacterium]
MLYPDCLRRALCTAALLIFSLPGVSATDGTASTASVAAVSGTSSPAAVVKPGIEVLRDRGFDCLAGKRVGLVTNPSGVDSQLRSTVDILNDDPRVNLVALFAPEHGIRGDVYAGGKVDGGSDKATGLPVHSLYGATREPTAQMLEGLDVVVYDIQDVGTRSYTFISTLGLVMRACAQKGVPVVVLDRPNPLGGNKVEGPLVRDGFHSFVGQYKIPYVYGLTVGELARLINEEGLNRGQLGNQKAVKIDKVTWNYKERLVFTSDMDAFQDAMLDLDGGSFKLWCYFSKNRNEHCFALSSRDAETWGIKRDAYSRAMKVLQEKGYLECIDKGKDWWEFHQRPKACGDSGIADGM